ncbi:MAG: B12-binding domain-containing radical SAM protein [Fervidicoccaceae archaeon]
MNLKPEVIITTDRTMMSNHHRKEFLGFVATGPAIGLPEKIWLWISSPKPKILDDGEPLEAPYGLRKVEAALLKSGIETKVVDPAYLNHYIETTKVLMIGHHDFFAYGPPSNEWWLITGKEPINRISFAKLMESQAIRRMKKNGVKIIVGGPAAWQWLYEREKWKKWGVDSVVDGESEKVIGKLVERALNGEEIPSYVYVGIKDVPSLEEIPEIVRPSVNGLVEIMRGCPRGCRFCSVTLRPLRFIPLEKIEREMLVNVKAGIKSGLLHSEDVLLYGADGVKPKEEPIMKLHEMALRHVEDLGWSHASMAAIRYAQEKYKLISKIMEMLKTKQDFLGVEVGLETGGLELAKKIMPAKSAPYPVEKWHETVEEAMKIMHENDVIPAVTLIIGMPEETEEDLLQTLELLDKIKGYRSLIVPMMFVPMGSLKNKEFYKKEMIRDLHIQILYKTYQHSIYWAKEIVRKSYLKSPTYLPLRGVLEFFMWYVENKVEKIVKELPTLRSA